MKLAVVSSCPDPGQQRLLRIVLPSWRAWAARHSLPVVVVEREPRPGQPYWGKHFLFEMPELAGFDAILHLDNDVIANAGAPSPADGWNPALVGMIDETGQWGWSGAQSRAYYERYQLAPAPGDAPVPIYNTGVFLMHRDLASALREIHASWQSLLPEIRRTPANREEKLLFVNDQPHVSLGLLNRALVQPLHHRFNQILPAWMKRNVMGSYRPFQLQAKFTQVIGTRLPRALARPLAWPSSRWIRRAVEDSHFLHSAGSKSPLWLYALSS